MRGRQGLFWAPFNLVSILPQIMLLMTWGSFCERLGRLAASQAGHGLEKFSTGKIFTHLLQTTHYPVVLLHTVRIFIIKNDWALSMTSRSQCTHSNGHYSVSYSSSFPCGSRPPFWAPGIETLKSSAENLESLLKGENVKILSSATLPYKYYGVQISLHWLAAPENWTQTVIPSVCDCIMYNAARFQDVSVFKMRKKIIAHGHHSTRFHLRSRGDYGRPPRKCKRCREHNEN